MEETTTNATVDEGAQSIQGVQVDDQGMAVAQPEETDKAEAVAPTTESKDESKDEPENKTEESKSEPSEDEQLASWAEKKGLTLDSENTTKAAKMAREAERAMHQKAQRASELEKSISTQSDEIAEQVADQTGQDPELLKRLQRVEVKESVRDFFDANPDAKAIETEMIAELAKRPHLAGDLEALYAVTKAGDMDAVKSQGKREALQNLAQTQQAAVPTGNATNGAAMSSSTTITPQNVDAMVGSMSAEEYKKRLPEINRALAG